MVTTYLKDHRVMPSPSTKRRRAASLVLLFCKPVTHPGAHWASRHASALSIWLQACPNLSITKLYSHPQEPLKRQTSTAYHPIQH